MAEFPPVVVSRRQQRLHSGGWFARGFTTTLGVLLAVVVAFVGVYYAVKESWRPTMEAAVAESKARDAARTARAKELAAPHLRKHGINDLSDDARIVEDGGDIVLVGHGRDSSGNLRRIMLRYSVASFGGKEHWKLLSTTIDGNSVYKAASPAND